MWVLGLRFGGLKGTKQHCAQVWNRTSFVVLVAEALPNVSYKVRTFCCNTPVQESEGTTG